MQKQAPSPGRIVVMVGFAISCFAILLYLWLVFGGATPLKPRGYRVDVRFSEATQLAQEAEVRTSGVRVGRVKKKTRDGTFTRTEIEIDRRFAPIAADSRAILRQKTLLGETYVELTPGSRSAPRLPDGGTLAQSQVSPTVELDEIFRTFDPRTRDAFRRWMEEQARAFDGRGEQLNDALGNLTPFAEDATEVLEILDSQRRATRRLVRNTGEVFGALTEREGQLRELIVNSNRVFETTAARDRELQQIFRVFPTFLDESRATVARVTRFSEATDPFITQFRPAARELSPTLLDLRGLAPDLRAFFRDLGPLIAASRRGLPALERFLDDFRPLLAQLDPFLRNVNPILDWLGLYKREIAAFFALDSAVTQATDLPAGAEAPVHYLRTTNPVNPEAIATYPRRLRTNRSNPYFAPGGYARLPRGLEVFGRYLCTSNPVIRLNPEQNERLPESTRALIERFVYTPDGPEGPPCRPQRPLGRLIGQPGLYPHLEEQRAGR